MRQSKVSPVSAFTEYQLPVDRITKPLLNTIDFNALKIRKRFEPAQQLWTFCCCAFNHADFLSLCDKDNREGELKQPLICNDVTPVLLLL